MGTQDRREEGCKKSICFVVTLPITFKAFLTTQSDFLVENGWDVVLICAEDSNFQKEIPANIRYIPLPFKRGLDFFGTPVTIIQLYRIFHRERFNIVQYSTPNAAFCASTAAWLAKVPVRLYAQWGIRFVGFKGITRRLFKSLERWCCRCSTIIEPDSLSNLEFSIQQGLYPRDKGRVIWNGSACGIDLERFNMENKGNWRKEYRKKLNIDPDELVIGFVGSIRRDKGCNELIGACTSFFEDIPNAQLLLIGDTSFYDSIDDDLQYWAESSKQVIFLPPNNEVPQYMACMDLFVLPSYREGFGMVVIEAQAMGVPVVVSDVPGPTDAMKHKETGLIVPVRNIDALAIALKNLLSDERRLIAYGAAAVDFSRNNFEQNEFLRQVVEDKESLLASIDGKN